MPAAKDAFEIDKFIHPAQIGSIEACTIDQGAARGGRTLLVNTGGGLRFRVLVDRGLDIDQAFFNQHSLTFLSHKGVTPPTRALDRGLDWLKGFPVGLLTSCGPFNTGSPCEDDGQSLGPAGTGEGVLHDDRRRRGDRHAVSRSRHRRSAHPRPVRRRSKRPGRPDPLGPRAAHRVGHHQRPVVRPRPSEREVLREGPSNSRLQRLLPSSERGKAPTRKVSRNPRTNTTGADSLYASRRRGSR